jgi:DNA-binding GntR family transcriptional regulator
MPVQRASAAEQIANELRAQIEAGDYPAGEPLPSDSELARRFDVSKPTVTKARAMLVALGLVESRAGAASIVRDVSTRALPHGNHLQRARRTGRIYPEGHYARILAARTIAAPVDVAAALGAADGSDVIERQRVTYAVDDAPLAKSITYFPAELADQCPELLSTARLEQGTTLYIEEQTGRRATSLACAVSCQPAETGPDSNAEHLALDPGSYVLAISTTTYDAAGSALAHEVEFHPPGTPVALDLINV